MVNEMEQRLEKLGMTFAASKVKELRERKRKLAIAYEHYRFVEPEKINAFQDKLKPQGKYMAFTLLEDYTEVPPEPVLMALEAAIEKKCFDRFVIASIAMIPDPILFGAIDGCWDKFFIAQWDDDVKIEDILAPNEG